MQLARAFLLRPQRLANVKSIERNLLLGCWLTFISNLPQRAVALINVQKDSARVFVSADTYSAILSPWN